MSTITIPLPEAQNISGLVAADGSSITLYVDTGSAVMELRSDSEWLDTRLAPAEMRRLATLLMCAAALAED